ncbi:hypothetical protein BJX63DRAFT_181192 [Aspergillus granulosus]|uniref:Uncharacterized protein n=1 Tax=Aspergillus granulosus TaxID=176169 RepID=A0ABR4I2V7_9EURO
MAGTLLCRSSRPSTRVGWELCHVLQRRPIRRLSESTDSSTSSPEAHRKTGPLQSDIFRFALTRNLRPRYGKDSDENLERVFRNSFIEEWQTRTPVPLWDSGPVESEAIPMGFAFRLKHAQNFRELQRIIEQVDDIYGRFLLADGFKYFSLALGQAERLSSLGEILSLINMLEMRLKRMGLPKVAQLHILGMQYAALGFCEPALEHHLRGYLSITRDKLTSRKSQKLVKLLQSSLKAISFQHPEYDTSKMRNLIKGSSDPKTPGLHDILWWSDSEKFSRRIGLYMALLVQIQDDTLHRKLWDKQLEKTTWSSPNWDFISAYEYALALADAGNSSAALTALTETSKRAGNSLPHLAGFHGLDNLLQHDAIREELLSLVKDSDRPGILHHELKRLEDRLGIKWQQSEECHIGAAGPPWLVASEQPILTIDGDSFGYSSSQRLVAEIEVLGCSKSGADLDRVAELLDEYEGDLVRVYIPPWDASNSEFYWVPQRSPIEFPETYPSVDIDDNEIDPARALGLIRISPQQDSFVFQPSLHMMQLGYIVRKQKSPAGDGLDDSPELEKTGHLVAFDRLNGCFMAIFTGNRFGSIDSTSEFRESVTFAGADKIARIYPLIEMEPDEEVGHLPMPGYHIEVDTSPNVVYDLPPSSLK